MDTKDGPIYIFRDRLCSPADFPPIEINPPHSSEIIKPKSEIDYISSEVFELPLPTPLYNPPPDPVIILPPPSIIVESASIAPYIHFDEFCAFILFVCLVCINIYLLLLQYSNLLKLL